MTFRRRRGVQEWRDNHKPVLDVHTLQIIETNNAIAKALIYDASLIDLERIAEQVVARG